MPSAPRGRKARKKRYQETFIEEFKYNSSNPESILNYILETGPGTLGIAILLTIIHLITIILSGDFFITNIEVVMPFVQYNPAISSGEIWRLVTPIFIHGSIFHLGGNLLFLFIFGWRLEELAGTRIMILTFFITGIGGNLLTYSLILIESNSIVSLGASGAVQGLLGASVTLMFYEKKYASGGLAFLSVIVIFFVLTIGAQTNFISHLGGLLSGILFSIVYYKISF